MFPQLSFHTAARRQMRNENVPVRGFNSKQFKRTSLGRVSVTPRTKETMPWDFYGAIFSPFLWSFLIQSATIQAPREIRAETENSSRSRMSAVDMTRTPYDRRDHSLLAPLGTTDAVVRERRRVSRADFRRAVWRTPRDAKVPDVEIHKRHGHVGEFLRRTCSRQRYAA